MPRSLKSISGNPDKAADRLDKAKCSYPQRKETYEERAPLTKPRDTGRDPPALEEKDKPPGFKEKHNPLSRPAQEAGIFVHNKSIRCVKGTTPAWRAHYKTEEAAERGVSTGAEIQAQGYRSHKRETLPGSGKG